MLEQNLREQREMMQDSGVATQFLHLNADIMDRTLHSSETKKRLLDTNLEIMKGLSADPEKRNQLLITLKQAREKALREKRMRHLLLKHGLDEHYLTLNTPELTPGVLAYNMDVLEKTLKNPGQKKRLMKSQLQTMKAIAEDPELRPELIALLIQLMKDPAMKKEMEKMIKPMMKKMEQQMKARMMQMIKSSQQQQSPSPKPATPPDSSDQE